MNLLLLLLVINTTNTIIKIIKLSLYKLNIYLFFIFNLMQNIVKGLSISPMPHNYTSFTFKSDISSIITDISSLLPQFSNFINQFNELVSQANINVITDSAGNLSIDVPSEMSDVKANDISKRISIIDRLINTRKEEINILIQKGLSLEKDILSKDSSYTSQLTEKIAEFNRLKNMYKH